MHKYFENLIFRALLDIQILYSPFPNVEFVPRSKQNGIRRLFVQHFARSLLPGVWALSCHTGEQGNNHWSHSVPVAVVCRYFVFVSHGQIEEYLATRLYLIEFEWFLLLLGSNEGYVNKLPSTEIATRMTTLSELQYWSTTNYKQITNKLASITKLHAWFCFLWFKMAAQVVRPQCMIFSINNRILYNVGSHLEIPNTSYCQTSFILHSL